MERAPESSPQVGYHFVDVAALLDAHARRRPLARLVGPLLAATALLSTPASADRVKKGGPLPPAQPQATAGLMAPQAPQVSAQQVRGPTIPPAATWATDLPSVADVRRAFPGDNADAEARRSGALTVMIKFIEGVSGGSQFNTATMPPAAAARLNEYDRPPPTPQGTAATLARGYQLAETYQFQREVLGKLVAKQSQDAYWSSRRGKEYLPSELASAANTGVVETTERTASFVAPDLAAAKSAGTDLSVFGIRLGEVLTLPDCPQSGSDDMLLEAFNVSTVASTCVVKNAGTLTQMFAQLAAVGSAVPWTSTGLSIKLAHSACPDWVTSGCLVVLNMQNGVPLGAFFTTSGVDQTHKIEGLLVNKYHRPAARGQPLQCENALTGALAESSFERHWQLPGLYVSYAPITMCPNSTIVTTGNQFTSRSTVQRGSTEGKVTIELSQFRDQKVKAGEQRQQRHEDSQPKL